MRAFGFPADGMSRSALALGGAGAAVVLTGCVLLHFPATRHAGMLLVIAPVTEEAAFRAGLQEFLLRRCASTSVAIVAVALAFAVAHVLLRGDLRIAIVALPALLLGMLYQRTRSVRACAFAHGGMNAIWLAWS